MSVSVVPLRQKHIYEMVGATSPYPFVGLSGIADGEVVALGGLVHQDGRWIAGLHMREGGAFRHPVALVKASRRILASARRAGLRVVAFCDPELPRAAAFMERLGFRRTGEDIAGEPEWVLEA